MTRKDLISRISQLHQLSYEDAQALLLTALDTIADALSHGEPVKINGFGSFKPIMTRDRKGRHPRTGELIDIPGRRRIVFTPGKPLAARGTEPVQTQDA